MKRIPTASALNAMLALVTALPAVAADPPVAARRPVTTTLHGDARVDEYGWLRHKEDPEVIAYLDAENAYTESRTAHLEPLQETVYEEILSRIKQTDLSVPYRDGPYYYYHRTVEGKNYWVQCRKRGTPDAPEEIVLDVNELAEGHDYFRVTSHDVSPDHRRLAYGVDTTGYESVSISVKDLETGVTHESVVTGAAPWGITWAADGRTLFYLRFDESKRPDRVYRHVLGTDESQDVLVAREDDPKFSIGVSRTRSDEYIVIRSSSSTTSEVRYVHAAWPDATSRLIAARRPGVRYSVRHRPGPNGGTFYILTDGDECPNFKIVTAPVADPGPERWEPLIDHSREVYLAGINVFRDHLVISERRGGYTALRVRRHDGSDEHLVELPETVATVFGGANEEYETDIFRFRFTSPVTPRSVFDYDMNARSRTLLKQTEILGGYDPSAYMTKRLWATARDGTRVPISVVYRKDIRPDGENPCLLYGYGSYGASMDPQFNVVNVSLLDRGFVFAVAHVRGGSEMGRHWKEDGKMLNKRNTFTDFIACAEHLIDTGYTNPDRLAIRGGSAGGLLIGAVINMRPDLFAAAHAAVPFVDVVNTMLDASIPLTTGEYEEWGNPADESYYRYIKSYSPYDNVAARNYPHLLVTAGLNDPRVHYWEPAKWTARLRALKTDDNMLLLKTNMGAGHGGASGRYARYEEIAFQYAFIIDRVGVPSASVPGRTAGGKRE